MVNRISNRNHNIITVLTYALEIGLFLVSAIVPRLFVLTSFDLFVLLFGKNAPSIQISYGLVIFIFAALFSIMRNVANIRNQMTSSIQAQWVSIIPVVVVGTVFYSGYFLNSSVNEIIDPYISYVLSVLFCFGAGYCFSELIIFLILQFRGKNANSD